MRDFTQFKEAIYPGFWDRGLYSFLHLEIKLKDTASLEVLKEEKEQASCFVTLVHEYIHYIQNFTTAWGFTNFYTYVDFLTKFFVDNLGLSENPELPLMDGIIDKSMGVKNHKNYLVSAYLGISKEGGKFVFDTTDKEDFSFTEVKLQDPYFEKDVIIYYIAFDGKQVPLNELVISENMAMIGSYLTSGLTLEESHDTLITFWGIQYNIIYRFIKYLFTDKDCFKLTYYFCEVSLMILPYKHTIYNILTYLANNVKILASKNEQEIIDIVLKQIHFKNQLCKTTLLMEGMLDERIELFSKYKEQYEFYEFLLDVLDIFKKGFKARLLIPHTYQEQFNSGFLNYWSDRIYSPILVFANGQKTMLGEPNKKFVNSVAYFSGVMKVFHEAYYEKIDRCIFNEEFSICQVDKGIECDSDALQIYGNEKYSKCILHNSLDIIGIRSQSRTLTS